MRNQSPYISMSILGAAIVLAWPGQALAQTFSSGSTGADGAFAPAVTTTVTLPPNGIFNYTTVAIPAGVTVTFAKNAINTPVTMLATGDVTIDGIIDVNGTNGTAGTSTQPARTPGVAGGPGGFAGGNGAAPNAGTPATVGLGPGGGIPCCPSGTSRNGKYGASSSFVSVLPVFGGSGGAGGSNFGALAGGAGGGGGGAIVIASSTSITVPGSIRANGGAGTGSTPGGLGSGGAIRLVAPTINGAGILRAVAGPGAFTTSHGRIRVEAFSLGFTGTSTPQFSYSPAVGPVTASSVPALILPTLTMTSIGGVAVPAQPTGSYGTPDVALPGSATNPVQVALAAGNVPDNTSFTVRVISQDGQFTEVPGSFGAPATTATAAVTLPTGQVSIVLVYSSFTLPQIARLFPLIDGEPVDHLMLAAAPGQPSQMTLVTASGKTVPASEILSGVASR